MSNSATDNGATAPVFQPVSIPAELKKLNQWVCWRYQNRNDKLTKPPVDAKSNGKLVHAKSNDPSTWSDFDTAIASKTRLNLPGIGLCVSADDGLTGLDLDHVIDPATGELDPLAVEVLERFKNTYAEISPSGTGLRIWCYGKPQRSGKCDGSRKWLEIYSHPSNRYLTVTGNQWPGSATVVTEQQAALDWLHGRFMVKSKDASTGGESNPLPSVDASLDLDDQALLTKARNAKNGAAFDALFSGDLSAHNGDHSAADLALCNLLAFWTGKDAPRMDRLFRQSGLVRPKWDELHGQNTYGNSSISKAIADCRDVFGSKRKVARPSPAMDEQDDAHQPKFDKHHPDLMCKVGTDQLLKNHYNAVMTAEKAYPGLIGYNEFRQRIEKRFDPPWGGGSGAWTDRDTAELACLLSRPFAAFSLNVLGYAVMTVAYRHPFNPAQERLRALADQWDGESRIDSWLVDYVGAKVNASNADYLREIGACWLKGVAARVLKPGCKRDDVLVLCGPQGWGKSTMAQALSDAIQPESFTDNLGDLSSKDSKGGIRGIVVAELGELASLGKSDLESIKCFVATRSDHFREAYGKTERDYPRTVSFIGTTNNSSFLIDPTGNRRWWPVTLSGPINIPRFETVVPQLLGEAANRVLAGERWHVTNEAALTQAENVRAAHFDEDIWTVRIKNAVADLMNPGSTLAGANTAYVTIPAILDVMEIRLEQQNKVAKNRVGSVLRQMKFTEHRNRMANGDRFRAWYPPFCPATPDDDGSCGPVAGQKEASQTAGEPASPASPATFPLNELNQPIEDYGQGENSGQGEDEAGKPNCFSSHIEKVAAHAAQAGLASQTAGSGVVRNWDATISDGVVASQDSPPPVDAIDRALANAATAKPKSRSDLARIAGHPKLPDLDRRINRLLASNYLAPLSGGLVRGSAP